MEKKIKLFVWEGVLADYTDGIMFALAYDIDEARALILKSYNENQYNDLMKGNIPVHSTVWDELQGDPEVHENPIGFNLWGGG